MEKRPIGVTILAAISGLLALIAIVKTLTWLGFFPWLGPGPAVRTFNLWYAFMYGLLAWVYIWLTQMLLKVDPSAWWFLIIITIFNLIIEFVALLNGTPWEWVAVTIILNGLILIYVVLPGTRRNFGIESRTKGG
jgi:hypothetical protein